MLGEEVAACYDKLAIRFMRHRDPLATELTEIEGELDEAAEELDVDLPALPEGETGEDESREWLFDSARDFLEQTDHFRRMLGKD